jgi:hypothetical protein
MDRAEPEDGREDSELQSEDGEEEARLSFSGSPEKHPRPDARAVGNAGPSFVADKQTPSRRSGTATDVGRTTRVTPEIKQRSRNSPSRPNLPELLLLLCLDSVLALPRALAGTDWCARCDR